jgi:hypothetical protein
MQSPDRYIVKWALGSENYPHEPHSTQQEALGRIKELFVAHGSKPHIELYLNDEPYLGFRALSQWHKGLLSLG